MSGSLSGTLLVVGVVVGLEGSFVGLGVVGSGASVGIGVIGTGVGSLLGLEVGSMVSPPTQSAPSVHAELQMSPFAGS